MKERLKKLAVVLMFGFVLYYGASNGMARQGLPTVEERVYGVSQIWKKAADHYALWELADREPTWDEAYETAYQEAVNAKSSKEYYLTLKKFLAHLHDGHAENIGYKGMVTKYKLPFVMEYRNGQYVIVQTANAHAERFPLGAVVRIIDGIETGKYLEDTWGPYVGLLTPVARQQQLCMLFLYAGEQGEKIDVELQCHGESETRTVTASWANINSKYIKQSYDMEGEVIYRSVAFDVKLLEDNLSYVNFKTQQDVAYIEEYFEKVVPLIQDSDGVILDVRSNAGGNSLVGHTILESFKGEAIEYRWQAADTIKISSYVNNYAFWNYYMKVAEDDTNPELAARMSRTLEAAAEQSGGEWDAVMEIGKDMYYGRFEVSDRVMNALQEDFKEKYPDVWEKMEAEKQSDQKKNGQESESSPLIGKPVVLLIGPNSGSATDTMAAEAKAAGFVLVGTRTRGATGNVLRIDAGGGWQVGISTQRGLTLEGKDINNNGIEATVFVEQNEEDAMNGVDTQVVKATEVLREMIE